MENEENKKLMKKNYGRMALWIAIFGVLVTLLQLFNANVIPIISNAILGKDITDSSTFSFLNIIIPMYLVGFPLLLLVTSRMEKTHIEKGKWNFGNYIVCLLLMFGMIGVGIAVGTIAHLLVITPLGVKMEDSSALADLMTDSNPFWRILTVGILAPIVEEMIFRKLLIDRVIKYGEWTAILTSGLMFGLFHGNFQQCFFAALIGGLFAYVYIRTGKIWCTMLLHATLNLMTSAVTVGLLTSIDVQKMERMMQLSGADVNNPAVQQEMTKLIVEVGVPMGLFSLWILLLMGLVLAGIITWIVVLVKKKIRIQRSEDDVKGGMKYAWLNIGMAVFLVYIVCSFVMTYAALVMSVKIQ